MNIAFLTGCIAAALYLAILLVKSFLSLRHFARHPESEEIERPITVLQPILGGDPGLQEALETNLRNASTCAIPLAGRRARFHRPRGDLTIGRASSGSSSQRFSVPNARRAAIRSCSSFDLAFPQIESEFFAVLDDDTMLSSGHLEKAIAALANCELYTGLPRYSTGSNVWSKLVAHFVNNNSILTYLSLLDWIGTLSINGMFYVMRTATLRKAGGFEPILTQLCDDYALARLIRDGGGRIQQGVTSQLIATSIDGPKHYVRLMHRWFLFATVLVRDQTLLTQGLLLLMLGMPSLLLWLSLLCLTGGWIGVVVLVQLLGYRHLVLIALHRRVFPLPPTLSWWTSPVSELLQTIHLGHASFSRVIVWRSRKMRVGSKGSFVEVSSGRQ